MVEKASCLPFVYLSFFTQFRENFFVCKQQRSRSASTPAQFYQLSLESMIAKPATCKKLKIKFLSDMRARIQTIPTEGGGGGGGRIASRGRFVPVFILGNKWQLMIFMGRSGPPCPLCLRPYQSVKQFEFTFFFAGPGQFTKRLLIISADAKGKDSMIYLRSKRPHTSIPATRCFKV